MYKWSWVIFAKKSKFHDAGGPDTVVSPITRVNLLIVNLDYTPKQTQLQGLRGTIDWINRKGLCDFDLYVLYQIWISILVDESNRKVGYESPKVITDIIS